MTGRVLVAYGSKYGATEEIAERIGKVLRDGGFDVVVSPARAVGDVAGYGAVVLGGGLYVGRWVKDAAKLLKERAGELAGKPVWLFSSGPTGKGDVKELMQGWEFPAGLVEARDRVKPRGHVVFHGAIDRSKLNLLERQAIRMVKAPFEDARDWGAIEAWARSVADELKREA